MTTRFSASVISPAEAGTAQNRLSPHLWRRDSDTSQPVPVSAVLRYQWITSYPAQHFADAGFAVLLMNYPYELGWRYGDFHAAARSQAYNPLASIERAVQMLAADGTADPQRVGIMRWSFGAWLTEFAISHTHLFRRASLGDFPAQLPGSCPAAQRPPYPDSSTPGIRP